MNLGISKACLDKRPVPAPIPSSASWEGEIILACLPPHAHPLTHLWLGEPDHPQPFTSPPLVIPRLEETGVRGDVSHQDVLEADQRPSGGSGSVVRGSLKEVPILRQGQTKLKAL